MPLSIKRLQDHVKHALGGGLSSELDVTAVVNEAGTYFMSMRSWSFASRPASPRDFKNGQSYITLPSDFGEIINARMTSSLVGNFTLTTLDQLVLLRTSFNLPVTGTYWGAVVWAPTLTTDGVPGGPTVARIEIAPTPTTDNIGGLQLEYRATWKNALGDQEYANVPQYAETLLIQIVRAFAMGYEEDVAISMSKRLAEIEAGPIFANAAMHDGKVSPLLGPPTGGAVAGQMLRRWSTPFWPSKIGP